MPVEKDFLDLMFHRIGVEHYSGLDADTQPTYGPKQTYQARVEGRMRLITDSTGVQRVSSNTIYTADNYGIGPRDRITLPDGSQPVILSVTNQDDEKGPYTQIVYT